MTKADKQLAREQQKKEDSRVFRVVITFLLALGAIYALVRIEDAFNYRRLDSETLVKWALPLALAAVVLLGIAVLVRKHKTAMVWLIYSCVVAAFAAVMVYVIGAIDTTVIKALYAVVPGAAVLYAIALLYLPDFTAVAATCAVGILYTWAFGAFTRRGESGNGLLLSLPVLLFGAAMLAAALLFLKRKEIKLGSRTITLPKKTYLPPLAICAAALLATIPLALLLGSTFCGIAMIAFIVYFFASAVLYTVRLM